MNYVCGINTLESPRDIPVTLYASACCSSAPPSLLLHFRLTLVKAHSLWFPLNLCAYILLLLLMSCIVYYPHQCTIFIWHGCSHGMRITFHVSSGRHTTRQLFFFCWCLTNTNGCYKVMWRPVSTYLCFHQLRVRTERVWIAHFDFRVNKTKIISVSLEKWDLNTTRIPPLGTVAKAIGAVIL